MTLTVRFSDTPPAWADMLRLLVERGYPVQMRMINSELAFPDEQPSEPWQELRLGTPGGMVTLLRRPDRIDCVVWGNADGELLKGWHALAWAAARAGGGLIETENGTLTADTFQKTAELPDSLRS